MKKSPKPVNGSGFTCVQLMFSYRQAPEREKRAFLRSWGVRMKAAHCEEPAGQFPHFSAVQCITD